MNARFVEAPASSRSNPSVVVATVGAPLSSASAALQNPVRHVHRQRDFGIGYGNSSGYGRDRRYTDNDYAPLFRCA